MSTPLKRIENDGRTVLPSGISRSNDSAWIGRVGIRKVLADGVFPARVILPLWDRVLGARRTDTAKRKCQRDEDNWWERSHFVHFAHRASSVHLAPAALLFIHAHHTSVSYLTRQPSTS